LMLAFLECLYMYSSVQTLIFPWMSSCLRVALLWA